MRNKVKYQTILTIPWETYIQVKRQQLERDIEQQTGLKLGNRGGPKMVEK